LLFKLVLKDRWSRQTWVDLGDCIRVIGTFEKANEFSLKLEDIVQEQSKNPKSSGMIVNNK
jgi:hypothetical protein